jgi:arylsulfatase A-like enzyme
MLKEAGYATGGFGKWGLGDNGTEGAPWKQGFNRFVGYLNQVHAHYFYPEFIYDNEKRLPLRGNEAGKRTTYSHDVIAGECLSFIRQNKDKPFFAYVPFTIPHLEILVPADSEAEYVGKFEEKPYIDKRKHYADNPHPFASYAGMVTRMDRDIGRILKLLAELGLEENTLVFFTSDNGGAAKLWSDDFFNSNGPLRGHKQNFYEGGIRVPMIARWPNRIPKGVTSDFPWAFWDIMPTFAEVADTRSPKGIDGMSVLPALLGKKQQPHEFFYWELPRYNSQRGEFLDETPMQAARMGDWKCVRPQPNGTLELYNLKKDLGESKDVAADNPKVLERLETYLASARVPPRPQKDPPQDFRR